MSRLTGKNADGSAKINALYNGLSFRHIDAITTVIDALDGHIDAITAVIEKLAEYEDAEENGTLVRLPCKVGDRVWVIYRGYVASAKVLSVYFDRLGGMFDLQIETNKETSRGGETVINKDYRYRRHNPLDDVGKTVFLTREEAEAAIKEGGLI